MTLNEYQQLALASAIYPNQGNNLFYPTLKLAGEAGEVAEKLGKFIRDIPITDFNNLLSQLQQENVDSIVKELGDVLWYISALSKELGFDLQTIAEVNIAKLSNRVKNNTLNGSGDDR